MPQRPPVGADDGAEPGIVCDHQFGHVDAPARPSGPEHGRDGRVEHGDVATHEASAQRHPACGGVHPHHECTGLGIGPRPRATGPGSGDRRPGGLLRRPAPGRRPRGSSGRFGDGRAAHGDVLGTRRAGPVVPASRSHPFAAPGRKPVLTARVQAPGARTRPPHLPRMSRKSAPRRRVREPGRGRCDVLGDRPGTGRGPARRARHGSQGEPLSLAWRSTFSEAGHRRCCHAGRMPADVVRPTIGPEVRQPRAAALPPRCVRGERRRACAGHGGCGSGWCCR